ncbi:MAG: TIGR04084 family radical SAM/SPASM domain-containing protein [Candidatus Bathyarchaeia archaeon]
MYYYVTLTSECNLQCRYCYGKCWDEPDYAMGGEEIDYDIPGFISYDIGELREFIARDPCSTLIFYGGEPLLRLDFIREIMDYVPARSFILQTNGILLDELDEEYLNRLDGILVSIDGGRVLTDFYRGDGTYIKLMENIHGVRSKGFKGEIIARMTVSNNTFDLEKEVLHLIMGKDAIFDSIHWQLDALFWKGDFDEKITGEWLENYNLHIRKLVRIWIVNMIRSGSVLRIYPFIGIARSILLNERSKLRGGAGWIMFNIQTDGRITPCPVMAGMRRLYLGDIWSSNPRSLRDSVSVADPCPSGGIYWICGGRCLYANSTRLWGPEGYTMVCRTVENLVESVRGFIPIVRRLLWKGRISIGEFNYPRFNSCEIIP